MKIRYRLYTNGNLIVNHLFTELATFQVNWNILARSGFYEVEEVKTGGNEIARMKSKNRQQTLIFTLET